MKNLILNKLESQYPLLNTNIEILFFWSISCGQCHVFLNKLNDFYDNESIFTIHVPLSEADLHKERMEAFLYKEDIKLPVYYDNQHELFAMIKSGFVPTIVLLDKDKDEITIIITLEEMDDAINKLNY
ncbi:TlpA family protein disulfide reductase [Massilibacterium senegalense]|uniref:TlpA family protein disulfide reductase n=1 Tax=Massilibacterium senegalense TaxID=1632858 RepID=UPI00078390EE|nr:thioredoxin-like domain-containing protein [Massilibacterium senegalense]